MSKNKLSIWRKYPKDPTLLNTLLQDFIYGQVQITNRIGDINRGTIEGVSVTEKQICILISNYCKLKLISDEIGVNIVANLLEPKYWPSDNRLDIIYDCFYEQKASGRHQPQDRRVKVFGVHYEKLHFILPKSPIILWPTADGSDSLPLKTYTRYMSLPDSWRMWDQK